MLEIKDGKFLLDGKKFNFYSGAMHYFRILPEYWEDRLAKLKAMGLNTVETYVCWNLHEPKHNEFDFSGRLDIKKYIQIADKLGLKVILRPGPYICAEWDMGGLPAWLLQDKNLRIRCNDSKYLEYCDNYMHRLFDEVRDCLSSNGGNIIAVQVENEYGSYGNDKKYLEHIKNLYIECGVKELLFTSDGDSSFMLHGGHLDGVLETVNLGSNAKSRFNALDKVQENMPKMCTEFWCGWFDHWGSPVHIKRPYRSAIPEIKTFLDLDANFNIYMFHGGTNFGFTAGANYYKKFTPTVTSYDYDAPLNEYGDYTKAYHAYRDILLKHQGLDIELPPRPNVQYIGEVQLNETTSLFDNLDNIGEKHYSPRPEGMEYYGQNSGLIYYKTNVKGKYGTMILSLNDLHDRAYIYIDGDKKATIDTIRRKLFKNNKKLIVNLNKDNNEISVLVDAMGHTNYGPHIADMKGISGINLAMQNLMDFEVTTLPLDNIDKLDYSKNSGKYPLFFRGTFTTDSNAECFVEFKNFTKGNIYVNGFNLGRFWNIGPQRTLYLPGALLRTDAPNEIVVLELEGCKKPSVKIVDKHNLGRSYM